MSSDSTSNAERLKAIGNDLHRQGNFQAAREKFSAAIKEDSTNAIYYANRAASSLQLKDYLDAVSDAQKATELNPTYAKAWSRLGTAAFGLGAYSDSISAFKRALKCLPPPEKSTLTELRFRAEIQGDLKKSRAASENPVDLKVVPKDSEHPWIRGAAMEEDIIAKKKLSSAIVILIAYREFIDGINIAKRLQTIVSGNNESMRGELGALSNITNGLMRDMRVFHMESDWQDKLDRQINYEVHCYKAWSRESAEDVKIEAPRRLQQHGWELLRLTLSTTVRGWLFGGATSHIAHRPETSLLYYSRALDIVEWGAKKWANVPIAQRGVIFEKTFIRGIKKMKLAAMLNCLARKTEDLKFNIKDMVDVCTDIVSDVDNNPPVEPIGHFEYASFWTIPKGEGLAGLAWYSKRLGDEALTAEDAQSSYRQASLLYTQAAKNYPVDDEKVLTYYRAALEAGWLSPGGMKIKDTLEIMELIFNCVPEAARIWEHSSSWFSISEETASVLEIGSRLNDAVRSKHISLNDVVKPEELRSVYKWGGEVVFI